MSLLRNTRRARLTATLKWAVPTLLATASGMLVAVPAQAAALTEVTGWSKNDVPTYISMYIYVPDKMVANPPIMVAAHYCGGNAMAYYNFDSAVVSLANTYGFIMIFPQTTNNASSADCWDVGSPKSLTHNGGGDTQAIVEMVDYTITKYSANAARVYSMGSSSGAMLTEALMGVYPDVFKAGAEMSGVPDGCWSDGWTMQSNWGGTCATGGDIMTGPQWGDVVRAQYPGYTGPRPRLWLWVGTADMTISPKNFTQSVLEWTNVLDLSSAPTSTSTPASEPQLGSGQIWTNSCGTTVLEAWTLQGGGHAPTPTAPTASAIVSFFGLDKSAADPASACGDAGTVVDASTGGADASGGGHDGSTGGLDATSGGVDASGGGLDASAGGIDATSGGLDASGGDLDASIVGSEAGVIVGSEAGVIVGSEAGVVVGSEAGVIVGSEAGVVVGSEAGVVVGSEAGSDSDGGTSDDNGAAGCGCRMGPEEQRFGGMLLAPIGAVLGILVRRRRRSRK